MSVHQIPTIFVVENHWLLGKIRLGSGQRVLDVLNETMSQYVTLEEASVFSSFDSNKRQAVLPQVAVLKDHLRLAISPTDRYEIPKKNRMHRIVQKFSMPGSAIASGYLIQGMFHLSSRTTDPTRILAEGLGRYFPMTAANVFGPSQKPIGAAAVLVNRDFVSSVSCDSIESKTDNQSSLRAADKTQRPHEGLVGSQVLANQC